VDSSDFSPSNWRRQQAWITATGNSNGLGALPVLMKPRSIASISPSKRASRSEYNRESVSVVQLARILGRVCPITLAVYEKQVLVECVHHLRGKNCEALRHDKRGWMLTSVAGNGWVHRNPSEAIKRGFLCPRGKWGTPFKPGEAPMPGSVADLESKEIL
jgi:hypothetical protein